MQTLCMAHSWLAKLMNYKIYLVLVFVAAGEGHMATIFHQIYSVTCSLQKGAVTNQGI